MRVRAMTVMNESGQLALLVVALGAAGCQSGDAVDDAVRVCRGTSVACSALAASECAAAQGCASGTCAGTPSACSHFATSTACILQQGCAWDEGQHACSGATLACSSYASASSCTGASGCAWGAGCSGKPAACEALSLTACAAQPGCRVTTGSASDDGGLPDSVTALVCNDAAAPSEIIDDMEDQTAQISSTTTFSQWFVYNDGSASGHQVPSDNASLTMERIPGGRCGSQFAMRMTGSGFTDWGAGMGFNFGTGPANENEPYPALPFDASAYEGLRFWARVGEGVTNKVGFLVNDKSSHPSGGVCTMGVVAADAGGGADAGDAIATIDAASSEAEASASSSDAGDEGTLAEASSAEASSAEASSAEASSAEASSTPRAKFSTVDCYNAFAKELVLTPSWVEYRVPLSELKQDPSWGYRAPALALNALYSVQFEFGGASTMDLWVDDISWYRAGE